MNARIVDTSFREGLVKKPSEYTFMDRVRLGYLAFKHAKKARYGISLYHVSEIEPPPGVSPSEVLRGLSDHTKMYVKCVDLDGIEKNVEIHPFKMH